MERSNQYELEPVFDVSIRLCGGGLYRPSERRHRRVSHDGLFKSILRAVFENAANSLRKIRAAWVHLLSRLSYFQALNTLALDW